MRRTTSVASLRSPATKSGRFAVSSVRILSAQKRSISTGRSAANTRPRVPLAIDLSSVKFPKARGSSPPGSTCRPLVVDSLIRAPPHGSTRPPDPSIRAAGHCQPARSRAWLGEARVGARGPLRVPDSKTDAEDGVAREGLAELAVRALVGGRAPRAVAVAAADCPALRRRA